MAYALLDVSQNGGGGYGDLQKLMEAAAQGSYTRNPNIDHLLTAFDAVRSTPFGPIHLIAQFMASTHLPLKWSEIEKHSTWLNVWALPSDVRSLKIKERVLQILLTNGSFLELALHNETHFSPKNWDTFEADYSRAVDDLKAHLAGR
jgi:hypothetical protein